MTRAGPVGEPAAEGLAARVRGLAPRLLESSLRVEEGVAAWLEAAPGPAGGLVLGLLAPDGRGLEPFSGRREDAGDGVLVHASTTPDNAAALLALLPELRPVPLGLATSAGFGDRLGLATPGHVAAMRRTGAEGLIAPIFAQQSIREMTRTRRSARRVLDDATWGAFAAGWRHPVGADADHLKTVEHVRTCLREGFTFFTFDPGEHVDDAAAQADGARLADKVAALPWSELEDDWPGLRARYLGRRFDADGLELRFDEPALARAAAKYGAALAHAARLYRVLAESGAPFEAELSVDETATPTTPEEHAYVALELARLGVRVVSLAPRFVGRFEKGVDFRGDRAELIRTLDAHARIARTFGPYKLSLHSGSDKFSVYGPIAEATRGLVHLKTAGTSYLEALRVAAVHEPALLRRILAIAHERFERDRASYLIGARLGAVPGPDELPDDALVGLLDDDDARQVLHVTFGSALDAERDALLTLLGGHAGAYEDVLAAHFERHLGPIVPHARGGDADVSVGPATGGGGRARAS